MCSWTRRLGWRPRRRRRDGFSKPRRRLYNWRPDWRSEVGTGAIRSTWPLVRRTARTWRCAGGRPRLVVSDREALTTSRPAGSSSRPRALLAPALPKSRLIRSPETRARPGQKRPRLFPNAWQFGRLWPRRPLQSCDPPAFEFPPPSEDGADIRVPVRVAPPYGAWRVRPVGIQRGWHKPETAHFFVVPFIAEAGRLPASHAGDGRGNRDCRQTAGGRG